jgi:hypothetical protein
VDDECIDLQSLDRWYREFESRLRHGRSSVVFVVYNVGSELCAELITCLGESYRVCVCPNILNQLPNFYDDL